MAIRTVLVASSVGSRIDNMIDDVIFRKEEMVKSNPDLYFNLIDIKLQLGEYGKMYALIIYDMDKRPKLKMPGD